MGNEEYGMEDARDFAAECEKLAKENEELTARMLRMRADFENARRRNERERARFMQASAKSFVAELLPTLDDFERAMEAETRDEAYAYGVLMVHDRFVKTLQRVGLERVASAGTFDPNIHQAIERVEMKGAEDQAVVEELARGYAFKGELLRPAMVRVAVKREVAR